MELIPCGFDDLSSATCSFARCKLLSSPFEGCQPGTALVVAFDGAAGNSHEHIGTFAFMNAMIAAGLAAWRPAAVILDLQRLQYWWGDEMHDTLTSPRDEFGRALPTAVVVSDLNREALTSLVADEMGGDPRSLLFESLEAALAAADQRQYQPDAEPGAAPS